MDGTRQPTMGDNRRVSRWTMMDKTLFVRLPWNQSESSSMAKMQLFDRCGRPALGRSSCSAASSALRWCTSRRWWLARDGWLGLGFVLLGAVAGPAQDAEAQADSRTIKVQVNLPYAVPFGFRSYDVGGLSVD